MDKKERKRETRNLIREAQKGNVFARGKAIELNLGLVGMVVKKLRPHDYLAYEDDFQNGSLGLLDAVKHWGFGGSFATYAVKAIKRRIYRERMKCACTAYFPIGAYEIDTVPRMMPITTPLGDDSKLTMEDVLPNTYLHSAIEVIVDNSRDSNWSATGTPLGNGASANDGPDEFIRAVRAEKKREYRKKHKARDKEHNAAYMRAYRAKG